MREGNGVPDIEEVSLVALLNLRLRGVAGPVRADLRCHGLPLIVVGLSMNGQV